MGNGESTARRISMQKPDEGSVQISEDVMWRLRKDKKEREAAEEPQENQIKIKEENLRLLIKDAFDKGKITGKAEVLKQRENKSDSDVHSAMKQIEDLREMKNKEIDDLQSQIDEIQISAMSQLDERDKLKEATDKQLAEIQSEKDEFKNKLDSREESLKVEFDRGVEEIQKIIRPLQNKTILCEQLQQDVIECYKLNRHHPLRCSKVVDEFRHCVNEARLKQMDPNGL